MGRPADEDRHTTAPPIGKEGENEAADLLGAAAPVWIALDEPGIRADVVERLADADQQLPDDVLDETLEQLLVTGCILTSSCPAPDTA